VVQNKHVLEFQSVPFLAGWLKVEKKKNEDDENDVLEFFAISDISQKGWILPGQSCTTVFDQLICFSIKI
jgi:hypothetical protein